MMKKTFALILALMLVLCAVPASFASKPGDTVTVTVSISGAGDTFAAEISYPSELIYVGASTEGSAAAGPHKWSVISTGTIGSASATYTFKISENAKPGTYNVTASLINGSGTLTGGSVTVGEPVHVHTPGDPVKENETDAGYDEVVYCTGCKKEISRVAKSVCSLGEGIVKDAKDEDVVYCTYTDPLDKACLVIAADLECKPELTTELGLYLSEDLVKQLIGEGYATVSFLNGSANTVITLSDIRADWIPTKAPILAYVFSTDPDTKDGILVKVEGLISDTEKVPAGKFSGVKLVDVSGDEEMEIGENGVYAFPESDNGTKSNSNFF